VTDVFVFVAGYFVGNCDF